jgi:hypothetical protein
MPRPRLPQLAVAALALLAGLPARADSIRCAGGIVSTGDSRLDLLGKCGPPTMREDLTEERSIQRVEDARTVRARSTAVQVERWTYNFGPNQFVQYVRLESGLVVAVERGSYGYDLGQTPEAAPPIPRARCGHLGFHVGDTTFDVLARCGEPAARDEKLVTTTLATTDGRAGTAVTTTETIEFWTYDFGPQVLVRRLAFAHGKVVRVETGGYGYSR